MKTMLATLLAALVCVAAQAQKNTAMAPKVMTDDSEPPPPMPTQRIYPETPGDNLPIVTTVPAPAPVAVPAAPIAPAGSAPYSYEQHLWGPSSQLITPQEAQLIVDNFRSNYAKLGNPRILIYVNRSLVDDHSGLKLSARNEQVETTSTWNGSPDSTNVTPMVTSHITANNSYSDNGSNSPTLADRQTVRDVERLMGGPFRDAGASLVDQATATRLIGDRTLDSITAGNDQARKDRETISKIADVALEVLISSRQVTVAEVSGDHTYNVPDIQATAIRLSDSKIIGQASAADVMNKAGGPGFSAHNFGVEAITQATALALMEDMTDAAK